MGREDGLERGRIAGKQAGDLEGFDLGGGVAGLRLIADQLAEAEAARATAEAELAERQANCGSIARAPDICPTDAELAEFRAAVAAAKAEEEQQKKPGNNKPGNRPGKRRVKMDESRPPARRIGPTVTVALSILVAAVAGLSIGTAAQEDDADPATTRQRALADSREATVAEVRRETARTGFTQGRKLGTVQGRRSGEAAGRADGRIQAQASLTRAAQPAAEAAQSALAEISDPPPSPGP